MEDHRDNGPPPRDRARRGRSSDSSSSSSRSTQRWRHRTTRHWRSRSRHRHASRKRRRSSFRRSSSSRESSCSSDRRGSNSSSSRGRRRSRSRWHRNSGGSRRGGAAAALLSSEPFSVRADQGLLERPEADWVCGVCSNPNSVRREECFRCGTRFAVSINATPSEEIKVSGLPDKVVFVDIQRALEDRFTEHGDTCRIVAYTIDTKVNRKDNAKEQVAYLLFDSVAEAAKALTYTRSLLAVGQTMCAMEFSLKRRANRKPTPTRGDTEMKTAVKPVDGLPDHLQPGVWKPVERFSSPTEEKEYLDLLSRHWEKLSQGQKDYYDEGVRRALAAQRRRQQQGNVSTAMKGTTPNAESTVVVPPSNGSSLENIKKRLAEKRRAVQGGASEGQTANEHTTSAASLKERLAMKKAQLSSVAKPSSVTETETAAVAVPSAQTLTSHKDTAPTPVHLFFGFPIPSRFPTKTDYLTHSKSPSFRAGLMFRYVPPAVAERIVPPSARPPPA
ncbi:hypothetical protein, conserved [Trypanosoma cruzi]|uniref:RanBP2-type domain-containing protein n=1 Tax=Trypanosoma cruzi (strain CL Brener) TaxID=353153 RepID=Q4DWT7_TRYCC|nr:hypothetical protein, conserved [Trypanosoma cruzi]EAN96989.1 hypothetical protein, conserved [Trypanosoma cruzi]|eukprot:XP_818840.1 hypothetical protein [Trypanosoma cruzi strain CL Brener]